MISNSSYFLLQQYILKLQPILNVNKEINNNLIAQDLDSQILLQITNFLHYVSIMRCFVLKLLFFITYSGHQNNDVAVFCSQQQDDLITNTTL